MEFRINILFFETTHHPCYLDPLPEQNNSFIKGEPKNKKSPISKPNSNNNSTISNLPNGPTKTKTFKLITKSNKNLPPSGKSPNTISPWEGTHFYLSKTKVGCFTWRIKSKVPTRDHRPTRNSRTAKIKNGLESQTTQRRKRGCKNARSEQQTLKKIWTKRRWAEKSWPGPQSLKSRLRTKHPNGRKTKRTPTAIWRYV